MAFGTSRNFNALCLVPPSNVARELALYKRRIFEGHGLASALLWPEMAIVAMGNASTTGDLALEGFWEGLPRDFIGVGISPEAEGFYLELGEAFLELSARGRKAFKDELEEPTFSAGRGFFLCGKEGWEASKLLEALVKCQPPALSFHAADLILCRMILSEDCPSGVPSAMPAMSWTRLKLSHRPRLG